FREENGALIATLGPVTRVGEVMAHGAPPELRLERRRKVRGALLTPRVLDELEGWVRTELQSFGYACPEVSSQADPETGRIVLRRRPGGRMSFVEVREEPIAGVEPWTLRRHDAFRLGDEYDGRWVAVTENRVTALDVVQSITLSTACEP